MLNQHNQLLASDETLKASIVLISLILWQNNRNGTCPNDILGFGEQLLHQLLLSRQLNFNVALTEATAFAAGAVGLEAVDSCDGLIHVDKFNIAV